MSNITVKLSEDRVDCRLYGVGVLTVAKQIKDDVYGLSNIEYLEQSSLTVREYTPRVCREK